jgi:hypothetical protein
LLTQRTAQAKTGWQRGRHVLRTCRRCITLQHPQQLSYAFGLLSTAHAYPVDCFLLAGEYIKEEQKNSKVEYSTRVLTVSCLQEEYIKEEQKNLKLEYSRRVLFVGCAVPLIALCLQEEYIEEERKNLKRELQAQAWICPLSLW